MTTDNEINAKLIESDVIRAYDRPNDDNLRKVLESVKRICNDDGLFNIEIISYLRTKGMGLVWATSETDTHSESRVGLHYKDAVFEIDLGK